MTDEAKSALGGDDHVVLATFPFRIGREARRNAFARAISTVERRIGTMAQLNDLYLVEPSTTRPYQISRRHCDIEHSNGRFFLFDRSSVTGSTILRPRTVGRSSARSDAYAASAGPDGRIELLDGDLIVLGTQDSPYGFRFQ